MKSGPSSSVQRILATTAILGASSVVGVLLATLRLKLAALVLGAAGVGLVGLVQNFMVTAGAVLGLGIGQAAPRQISKAASSGPADEQVARSTLVIVTLVAALFAAVLVAISAKSIAAVFYGDPSLAWALAWMSIGTGLTIVAASQIAFLAGLGRIRDVARISIISAILGTIGALLSLYAWGARAVVPFVLAAPAAASLVGAFYTGRGSPRLARRASHLGLRREATALVSLGLSMMVAVAISSAAQLAVRALISRDYGLRDLGLFHAAWTISTIYLSMILQAMSVDYFPRLSAASGSPADANRLINEQTLVGITLGGPVILLVMGVTPWALQLLYSAEFRPAAAVLRWQLLGDVFRLASWPLGYMLLAAGSRRTFLLVEAVAHTILVLASAALLPVIGVEAAGSAFLCMYAIHLPITFLFVRRLSNFKWTGQVAGRFSIIAGLAALIFAIARANEIAAAIVGVASSAILIGLWAGKLIKLALSPGPAHGSPNDA